MHSEEHVKINSSDFGQFKLSYYYDKKIFYPFIKYTNISALVIDLSSYVVKYRYINTEIIFKGI